MVFDRSVGGGRLALRRRPGGWPLLVWHRGGLGVGNLVQRPRADLVGREQQLPHPGEQRAQRDRRSILDAIGDLRDRHDDLLPCRPGLATHPLPGVSPIFSRATLPAATNARQTARAMRSRSVRCRVPRRFAGARKASSTMRSMPVKTRRVLVAKPRGYCAGVDRAVQTVEVALERFGAPVYVRKQIVHNKHVVADLERRGAVFVEETEEIPEGAVVVFSAHGVAPQVRADAKARDLRTIDATCPLVTKVHNEARRFAAQGYDILLIGHEGHEEVIGTTGEASTNIHLVDGPKESDDVQVRDPAKVSWLSQTTLSVDVKPET